MRQTYIVGFCPSCFTFGSFSSDLISFVDDEDFDEEGVVDDEFLLLKLDDCGVVGD